MSKKNKEDTSFDPAALEAESAALATTSTTALAVDDGEVDFLSGEFAGHQTKVTADELVTERFRICQAMTKCKRDAGLQDGQLYGNLTKKALDSAVIVPIVETRSIIERTGDTKGMFVEAYDETAFGSNDFGDARINAYVKKVSFKNTYKLETDNGNKLVPTYNCYVAFLDETGTECKGFGVLQADKTNILPFTKWLEDRCAFEGSENVPTFAFRTRVDGKGTYKNPEGQITQLYRFTPFQDQDWKKSLLRSRALLNKLQEHKKLVTSGAIKIAEHTVDEVESETSQEDAAF